MPELRQGHSTELWQSLITESATSRGVKLDEHEQSYLGFVLIRHLRDEQLGARVMSLDWLHAQDEIGRTRADALRDVGDRCLLIAGLFPRLAERRHVSPDYFTTLGRGAYAGVAECTRSGYADLFAQLAGAFLRLVDVLGHLRQDARGLPPLVQAGGGWLRRNDKFTAG